MYISGTRPKTTVTDRLETGWKKSESFFSKSVFIAKLLHKLVQKSEINIL